MSLPTYLEYTIVPNPLTTGKTQDLLILATLKTSQESGEKVDRFDIDHIKINFGTKGTGGSQLSDTEIGTGNFDSSNWTAANDSNSQGMIVKLTPNSGYNQVKTNAVQIKINNVQVNDSPGNATITITEVGTAKKKNGQPVNQPPNSPQTTGEASLVVQKVASENASKVIFGAEKPVRSAGDPVKLNWTGGEPNLTYTLHYLLNDQLVEVTKHAPPNNQNFKGTDQYPRTSNGYDDPVLTLSETTTFILEIGPKGDSSYLTTTVIVENGDIYVKDATITNDLTVKNRLKANQAVFNDASPWLDFNVGGRAFFESGEISTINTFEFKRKNSEGDRTLMGSLDKSKLKINGDIEATGYISSTQDIITDKTLKGLGGWGTKANWSTGYEASTGGQTFEGVSGFSLSNGKNTYGYYWLDLGGVKEGTLIVDMYIASNNTHDVAFFNIQSSTKPLNSSGQFPDVTCSREIWSSSYQAPSWSNSWNGAYMTRKLIRTPFYGRYIYIGVLQLEGGQQGIAIRKVTAQAPT